MINKMQIKCRTFPFAHSHQHVSSVLSLFIKLLFQAMNNDRVHFEIKLVGKPMAVVQQPAELCGPIDANTTHMGASARWIK